jgi:hypothetical protein
VSHLVCFFRAELSYDKVPGDGVTFELIDVA